MLTGLVVRRVIRQVKGPVVLWLYDAASSELVGACGETAAVYDCVDDHIEVAGDDQRVRALLTAADNRAARSSTVVITTTRTLYERHRATNPRTHLVPNVGDYEHFAPAASRDIAADEVSALTGPVLGFTGNVAAWKVDFDLLTEVARRKPSWTLVLVGPTRADTLDDLSRLSSLPNVHYFGSKPYERVPEYVAGFDVGLCPYLWNAAMRSGFPLKLYEYLAAGKPVVASGNPDVAREWNLTSGSSEAPTSSSPPSRTVLALDGDGDRARRMTLAAANTWETRTRQMLDLVQPYVEQ